MFTRTCSRRGFIGLTGAGIASVAGGSWLRIAAAADAIDPDLVVFNAKVYTLDSRMPKAEAFAVRGSRFVAVGSSEEIRNLAGKRTRTLDAGQMTIVPGFIDCHNHASGDVLLYEVLVGNPFEVEFVTIASVVDKLRKKASETPAGTWVEGYFFDDTKVKDKRQLNASDLDGVSTDHPVAVHHRGGHTAYYNNKALQMAGITRSSPNPPGALLTGTRKEI
jgi:predicted amidohydrolase YtcJ